MAKQLKTMSGYCQKKCIFSFCRNLASDGADWTSTGRLFQRGGPAAANERSPIVTSRDGRTLRRLEVDERRPRCLDGRSATYRSWPDKYWGAVPWRARYTMTANLNLMRSKPVETGKSICNMRGRYGHCLWPILSVADMVCGRYRRPPTFRHL